MASEFVDVATRCPHCGHQFRRPYTGFGPKQTQQLGEWHSYICRCGMHIAVNVWFVRGKLAHQTVSAVWRTCEPEAKAKGAFEITGPPRQRGPDA